MWSYLLHPIKEQSRYKSYQPFLRGKILAASHCCHLRVYSIALTHQDENYLKKTVSTDIFFSRCDFRAFNISEKVPSLNWPRFCQAQTSLERSFADIYTTAFLHSTTTRVHSTAWEVTPCLPLGGLLIPLKHLPLTKNFQVTHSSWITHI